MKGVSGCKHEGDNKRECMLDIPVTQFIHCKFLLGVVLFGLAGKVHSFGLGVLAAGSS